MENNEKRSPSFDWDLTILESVRKYGKLPETGRPKQTMDWYVSRLKKQGRIKRIGYGVWEVIQTSPSPNLMPGIPPPPLITSPSPKRVIRGHGFIWRLVFPKEIKGGEVLVQFLKQGGIVYDSFNKGVISFLWKGYEVSWSKYGIVFYVPKSKSFYGASAEESRKLAFYEVSYLIKGLESSLGLNFKSNGQYILKLTRQHYGDVDNALAKERVKAHEPLRVAGSDGEWLLVDLSQGLVELETVHPRQSGEDMDDLVKPWFNDLKEQRPPLSSEQWKVIQELRKASNLSSGRLLELQARIHCPDDVWSYKPWIEVLSESEKALLTDWLFESDCGRGR
jgi:hypothetical protein